jgi:predicted SnoaL-like aldol condensation-catalyzing enzyme
MPKRKSEKMKKDNSQIRKKIVREYFKLIMQGRQKDSLRYFAKNCRQHNPYTKGGMEELFEAMTKVQQEPSEFSDPSFSVKKTLVDGNMIAVHTELLNSRSKPSKGGLRQIHLFRFSGNKIAEYWDITQSVSSDMPNAANAF